MAKKKINKETTQSTVSAFKVFNFFKNETFHFIIGLILVFISVYLLLAFTSFFFTGAADQSLVESGDVVDLAAIDNKVKNYAGSRGAQLAHYLINDCFGVAFFFTLVCLAISGLKVMCVCIMFLWKWGFASVLVFIWF